MQKPDKSQDAAAKAMGQADEAFAKRYPIITTYLVDTQWDDGSAREASALAFTVKDGCWQVALNDKALKRSFYTVAPTMTEALKLLEKALSEGLDAWRAWKRGK